MIYNILATGSAGNAVILDDRLLVDCGVPYKTIEPFKRDLRVVFLTHTHGDHFNAATIRRLAHDRPSLRFACCEWMVLALYEAGVSATQIDVFKPDGWASYYVDGLSVYASPVALTHNVQNCGWKISTQAGTVFYATDTGTLDGIEAKNYDLYLVEANHTRAEIEARLAEKEAQGVFAYERKAAENHLSFEQTVDWLTQNMGPDSVWVPMHGHIVKEGGADHAGAPNAGENDY